MPNFEIPESVLGYIGEPLDHGDEETGGNILTSPSTCIDLASNVAIVIEEPQTLHSYTTWSNIIKVSTDNVPQEAAAPPARTPRPRLTVTYVW